MPYIIAFVIIVVAAGALLLFRQSADIVTDPVIEEAIPEQIDQATGMPEGFTPPTQNPPALESDDTTMGELDVNASIETAAQTFVAETSYFTPRRTQHNMVITFELTGETVTDINVDYDGAPAATPAHMGFDSAYKSEVLGENINNIQLSRVGGASLTSTAFNEAVAEVRAQL